MHTERSGLILLLYLGGRVKCGTVICRWGKSSSGFIMNLTPHYTSCEVNSLEEAVISTSDSVSTPPRRSSYFLGGGGGLEYLHLVAARSTEHEDAITRGVRDSRAS
jgi:hypothetical protein